MLEAQEVSKACSTIVVDWIRDAEPPGFLVRQRAKKFAKVLSAPISQLMFSFTWPVLEGKFASVLG